MKKQFKAGFSLIELSIVILIIGILIAGVTQASKLFASAKLSTARTLTQSSPVAGIKDLAAWWETTSEKSFVESETEQDGSSVSTWYNINPQAAINQNAAQSDSGKRPTYSKNAINGLPALHFDGSTQYLLSPYSQNINAKTTTVFVVAKTPTDSSGTFFSSFDEISGGYALFSEVNRRYELWNYNSNTVIFTREDSLPIILTVIDNGTSLKLYNNGTYVGVITSSVTQNQSVNLGIGVQVFEGFSFFYKGDIGELIFFSRDLNEEEQKAVEKYLIQKWNISIP